MIDRREDLQKIWGDLELGNPANGLPATSTPIKSRMSVIKYDFRHITHPTRVNTERETPAAMPSDVSLFSRMCNSGFLSLWGSYFVRWRVLHVSHLALGETSDTRGENRVCEHLSISETIRNMKCIHIICICIHIICIHIWYLHEWIYIQFLRFLRQKIYRYAESRSCSNLRQNAKARRFYDSGSNINASRKQGVIFSK